MPCSPPWLSFEAAPLGEQALRYTPDPAGNGKDLCLYAANLQEIDAPLAVATRASIEHYAAKIPVVLEPPADPECCAMMLGALGEGLPTNFSLVHLVSDKRAGPSEGVLLAATAVPEFMDADALTARLATELPEMLGERTAGFLVAATATLLENSLQHPLVPSTDPVVAITRHPKSDLIRLAVCDTGTEIESDAEADQRLAEALERSEEREGGLIELGLQAERLEIPATLCLGAGTGRLRLSDGRWAPAEDQYVAGTTAILELPPSR